MALSCARVLCYKRVDIAYCAQKEAGKHEVEHAGRHRCGKGLPAVPAQEYTVYKMLNAPCTGTEDQR